MFSLDCVEENLNKINRCENDKKSENGNKNIGKRRDLVIMHKKYMNILCKIQYLLDKYLVI